MPKDMELIDKEKKATKEYSLYQNIPTAKKLTNREDMHANHYGLRTSIMSSNTKSEYRETILLLASF